jgi:Flp pilus assembly protein TadD
VKLGVYLSETGSAERAIHLLEGLAGDDIEALNALGIAYGTAHRSADAIRSFKHVLEVDPTNGLGWQNIGTVQLRDGDRSTAEASLRRALAIDDTLSGACTTLGVVLSQTGRASEAIEMWKRAVTLSATEYDALYNLTVTLVDLGRRDEARSYGARYVATAPPGFYAQEIARVGALLK